MTLKEKELLLKDLCARLSYGVMIQYRDLFYSSRIIVEKLVSIDRGHINDDGISVEFVKPYLRSMSNMTEEEEKYYDVFCLEPYMGIDEETASNFIDWLNKNMFDYRGLIEKGLALEAPKGMYDIK